MGTSHRKVKSVAKLVVPKSQALADKTLATMQTISDIVGATLGPGGCPVLIERQEYGLPNLITKDGVTVFRNLGFNDPVAHAIMETARDASVRTATEAGDGTTTATVLSEAIVRRTHRFTSQNPKVSPQRVVRTLEKIFAEKIEPTIKSLAVPADDTLLRSVAKCSANGDDALADAVMECFRLVGDDGNITITEESGPSGYRVEPLKGYPVGIGYEDCTRQYFSIFVNDRVNSRVQMDDVVFVLYYGSITNIEVLVPLMRKLGAALEANEEKALRNVVVVATGFSDQVLAELAGNWKLPNTLNVYPLVVPKSPLQNGQLDFLQDIQSMTGATIFDPLTRPLEQGRIADVGHRLESFEATRYRSNIIGEADEGLRITRVEELQQALKSAPSELVKLTLQERIGKLTGGIAKLVIVGPSSGEVREKRDRADDAACAVRGARAHGCLPGGCWTFVRLIKHIENWYHEDSFENQVANAVLAPALEEPLNKLLSNAGYSGDEVNEVFSGLYDSSSSDIFDAMRGEYVDYRDSGVVDSVPAVLESVRSSISIASLLGTLGGTIVFPRDVQLERQEAIDMNEWMRNANTVE